MLLQRVATAAVGLPIFLTLVFIGGVPFAIGVAVSLAIATAEFYRAARLELRPGTVGGGAWAAIFPFLVFVDDDLLVVMLAALFAQLITIALGLFWARRRAGAWNRIRPLTFAVGGLLYVGWLGSHAVALRELPDGRDWLLLALLTVWITDSAAYFVGRTVGRRLLAPAVSPRKTWEGAVAGMVGGIVAVIALHEAFDLEATTIELLALAMVLPVVGQLGDLGESALKRSWGVKDTGWLLPGHGGFLDRIDSLLVVVPVVYYWVRWLVM